MDKRHSSGTWLINGCALQKTPTHNPLGARTAVHILPIGGSTEVQDRSAGRKGHFTPTHCSNYKSSKPRPVTQTQLFIGLIGVRAEWIEHHELRIALLQSLTKQTEKQPRTPLLWNSDTKQAFTLAKQELAQAPVLILCLITSMTSSFLSVTKKAAMGLLI